MDHEARDETSGLVVFVKGKPLGTVRSPSQVVVRTFEEFVHGEEYAPADKQDFMIYIPTGKNQQPAHVSELHADSAVSPAPPGPGLVFCVAESALEIYPPPFFSRVVAHITPIDGDTDVGVAVFDAHGKQIGAQTVAVPQFSVIRVQMICPPAVQIRVFDGDGGTQRVGILRIEGMP